MKMKPLPLEKLCLYYIHNNISFYAHLYSETKTYNDELWQKQFHLFQKIYSQVILDKSFSVMETSLTWGEHHFDLLLNKYVERINVGYLLNRKCEQIDIGEVFNRLMKFGESFKELLMPISDLMYSSCGNIIQDLFHRVPNVVKVRISGWCDDELIKAIASSCPNLIELHIDPEWPECVTGESLRSLCLDRDGKVRSKCHLKTLDVFYCNVTCKDIAFLLENIPSLEILKAQKLLMALSAIYKSKTNKNSSVNVKYNLRSFDLNFLDMGYSESLKMCTELCPLVEKSQMNISPVKDFETSSKFMHLVSIGFESNDAFYILNLKNCFSMTNGKLKKLVVINCTVSLSSVMEHCPSLQSLTLRLCVIREQEKRLKFSNTLRSLRNMKLSSVSNDFQTDYNWMETVFEFLKNCPNLKYLKLYYMESTFISELSKIPLGIERLELRCSNFDLDTLENIISNFHSLTFLGFDFCDIRGNELKQFIRTSQKFIEIEIDVEFLELHMCDADDYFDDKDYD